VTVRNRPNLKALYRGLAESRSSEPCEWISFDLQNLEATITAMPTFDDVSLPVDVGQVVALLSR
jgi:small subunit ribosomal protein S4